MVEIWDGLGLDRLRHGPRHVIARWPRVKYLVRDVGVHIADALAPPAGHRTGVAQVEGHAPQGQRPAGQLAAV
jgi:hypothetical protein